MRNKKEIHIEDFDTKYEYYRKKAGYSREKASELLPGISADKLYRIENGTQIAEPYDVIQMAKLYNSPELCNYHCSNFCDIGKKQIPKMDVGELPSIVLQTIGSLNEIQPLVNRLIQITMDGNISDDEIKDFALIQTKLDQVSYCSDVLDLWIKRTINENQLNGKLFNEEIEKLKQEV